MSGDADADDSTPPGDARSGSPAGSDGEPSVGPEGDRTGSVDEGATGSDERRHERVTAHRTPPGSNALAQWFRVRHPLRVVVQYVVVWLIRVGPSLRLRRWLLRRLGATVEGGVALGLEATPDVFWPDRITLREDAVVGYDATLLCHEFLQDEYRVGPVEVGERAMIGAGTVVLPGVEIGHDASVAANSLVTRDVPPGATVAGVPAEPMGEDEA